MKMRMNERASEQAKEKKKLNAEKKRIEKAESQVKLLSMQEFTTTSRHKYTGTHKHTLTQYVERIHFAIVNGILHVIHCLLLAD